jgi:hypothetical protein
MWDFVDVALGGWGGGGITIQTLSGRSDVVLMRVRYSGALNSS